MIGVPEVVVVLKVHAFLFGLRHYNLLKLVVDVQLSHCFYTFVSFVCEITQQTTIFEETRIDALLHQYFIVSNNAVTAHGLPLVRLLQQLYVLYCAFVDLMLDSLALLRTADNVDVAAFQEIRYFYNVEEVEGVFSLVVYVLCFYTLPNPLNCLSVLFPTQHFFLAYVVQLVAIYCQHIFREDPLGAYVHTQLLTFIFLQNHNIRLQLLLVVLL